MWPDHFKAFAWVAWLPESGKAKCYLGCWKAIRAETLQTQGSSRNRAPKVRGLRALGDLNRRDLADGTEVRLNLCDSRLHGVELLEHSRALAIETLIPGHDATAVEFDF